MIDQWDVMGMRATVSHSVRITDFEVPPERLIGEPGAWTRRDPRTFTLAFAANHIGAAGAALEFATDWVRERPSLAASEITRATLGAMSSELFAARSALYAARRSLGRGRLRPRRAAVDPCAAPRQARRARPDPDGVRRLRRARRLPRLLPLERLYRDVRTFSLHYRDEQYMIQVGQAMLDQSLPRQGLRGRVDVSGVPGLSRAFQVCREIDDQQRQQRRPRSARLATSIRSPRAHESWQIGPNPSSVGTPSAAAKLASEPPRELTGSSGSPSSRAAPAARVPQLVGRRARRTPGG